MRDIVDAGEDLGDVHSVFGGNVATLLADDDTVFDFPLDLLRAGRERHRFVVG